MIEDQSQDAHVVGIAMGEEGLISRVLSPRAGAAFTFASLSEGTETAPGQVSARTLLDVYRLEQLDQATRRFAELMMEAAVSTAIRGKTMDAAGDDLGEAVTAPHAMAPAEFK